MSDTTKALIEFTLDVKLHSARRMVFGATTERADELREKSGALTNQVARHHDTRSHAFESSNETAPAALNTPIFTLKNGVFLP